MVDDRDGGGSRPGSVRPGGTIQDGHAPTLATPVPAPPQSSGPPTLPMGPGDASAPVQLDLEGSRYTLGGVVGQGGMGEVVLAFDEQLRREVAVKRLRAERPSPDNIARFVREARVQGWLEHPAIVPVHDIAVDRAGRPYFVMKRLSGTEMHELLERLRTGASGDRAALRRRLLRAFVDVCLAVEFAHSRGVVHRDLKPANIMLGDFGEVYVLDWGIARTAADSPPADPRGSGAHAVEPPLGSTLEGTVLGTPAYMSPEQLAGETAVGPAADLYALGCILYEILAGEPLHPATRSIADAGAHLAARPSARRPDSPPELDAICERATALEPAARFASARALGNAVQAFLDGDRDLEARAELARQHVAAARDALARGDDEADRRAAMQEAGRALALDPTATEAAELVSRLMLEPPRRVPGEVEAQMTAIETTAAQTQARIGAVAMTGYLWFVPLLWWTGIRDPAIVVAFAVTAVAAAGQVYLMSRETTIPTGGIYLSAIIHAVLIALVCRMVGPFVIAPTLVLTTLMAYAMHPKFGQIQIIGAILGCGVAVPWLLELAGVIDPTYHFVGGSLVLTSPTVTLTSAPVQLAFAVVLVLLVAVVAVLLRHMANQRRAVTQQIELQAWHLRQIVATRGGGKVSARLSS
jgi:serine/threonine-protein kinase